MSEEYVEMLREDKRKKIEAEEKKGKRKHEREKRKREIEEKKKETVEKRRNRRMVIARHRPTPAVRSERAVL